MTNKQRINKSKLKRGGNAQESRSINELKTENKDWENEQMGNRLQKERNRHQKTKSMMEGEKQQENIGRRKTSFQFLLSQRCDTQVAAYG